MTNLMGKILNLPPRCQLSTLDKLFGVFADFDRFEEQVPLHYLQDRLQALSLERRDVGAYVAFDEGYYQRHRLYEGRAFRALILCWRSGQRSPIHNHKGSNCFVKVIEGTATEIEFSRSDCGLLFPREMKQVRAGESTVCQDNEMHQVGNLQPAGQDLVTLHVYSPPLQRMDLFSLEESVFADYDDLLAGPRQ
ncbi:MAG: cysteine dioxygenase family protein [Candidatus Competibacteraceae bacterium]